MLHKRDMWACRLPTSAPTMSLARPSQEEGQLPCRAFSPKIWSSLTGPVRIPPSNLGAQLRRRAVFQQGTHQPSLSPLWEETQAQTDPQHPCSEQHPHYWRPWGGLATHLKSGSSGLEVYDTMKSRIMLTNLSVKAGPNFSNQMSRLNLTFSRQGRGQLVASERNRTKLIMRQYCLI